MLPFYTEVTKYKTLADIGTGFFTTYLRQGEDFFFGTKLGNYPKIGYFPLFDDFGT